MSSESLLSGFSQLRVDQRLVDIYTYFYQGGYPLMLLKEIGKLIMLSFTGFFTLLLYLMPWNQVLSCRDTNTCESLESYITLGIHSHRGNPSTYILLGVLSALLLVQTCLSLMKIIHAKEMHFFYTHSLLILQEDLDTISWRQVINALHS